LRYVTQAGGPMSRSLTDALRQALPRARLYRMYGQTEATSRLTWLPPESLADKPESVGIGVEGVQLEIRDEDGRSLPAGAAGQVWARGPNIMRGYWRDDAATARVLRDGWLLTGDRGHLDEQGYLYVDGRLDDMIKTGAHRVNPADVEAVIASMPGVVEVAVLGMPHEVLGQVVRACVVTDGLAAPAERSVQRWCLERLAAYMVPKVVEFRDALPRTASGKVRRFELAGSAQ
jgi:acyl-CoA synthetase (AMP-forming)/AMP-acid ligase II